MRKMNESMVLEQLGIKDFRHLNKGKVIELISLIDRMEPEVAKKVIEQFPEFSKLIKELLSDYYAIINRGFESNNECIGYYYGNINDSIKTLNKLLEDENLSFENKKYIIERIRDIQYDIYRKDTENKEFNIQVLKVAGVILGTVVLIASAFLGGSAKVNFNNFNNRKYIS